MVNGLIERRPVTLVSMKEKRGRGRPPGKGKGRSRDAGDTVAFTLELAIPLKDALDGLSKKDRRSRRAIMEIALEEYLTKHGFWPPPAGD